MVRASPASLLASAVASSSRAVLPLLPPCASCAAAPTARAFADAATAAPEADEAPPTTATGASPRRSTADSSAALARRAGLQLPSRQRSTPAWVLAPLRSPAASARTLASAAAAPASSASDSGRPAYKSPTPAIHLPTLARLSPTAYNSLRPVPLSSVSAFAARLHPAFLPRTGADQTAHDVRARRLALVQQALTHPSWFALWEQTQTQHPEAFVADTPSGTAAPFGLGRGVVVEEVGSVRGDDSASAGSAASRLELAAGNKQSTQVQSVLLAATQYLALPETALTAKESLHNASLANLGNSLLGLFASEHLHLRYPHIPTRVLKAVLASYVGPTTSAEVAIELGLRTDLLRWDATRLEKRASFKVDPSKPRTEAGMAAALEDAASQERKHKLELALARVNRRKKGFVGAEGELLGDDSVTGQLRQQDVLASAMRSLVAILYQEMGISVARQFVSSRFLTRLVPLPSFLKFNDPKRTLSTTLDKYGLPAPQSRLVAETGRLSINPVFVVGIWSAQNKIGEGSGSSLRMAEYRAAEDALRRLYLAESDPAGFQVPSLTLNTPGQAVPPQVSTDAFVAQPLGRSEVVQGSHA